MLIVVMSSSCDHSSWTLQAELTALYKSDHIIIILLL